MVQNCQYSSSARRWSPPNGLRLSQSLQTTDNSLRNSWLGRALCGQGVGSTAGGASKACAPTYHPSHHRHPFGPRRSRHQYNPCVARTRVARYHQYLRRDRPCHEKTSTGDVGGRENTTGSWRMVPPARCHGFPACALASQICGARVGGFPKDQRAFGCAPHMVARHIIGFMWPAT